MSYMAVNKAIAGVVMEAKLSVVDDLIAYLEEKIEVDEDMKGFFDEFKSNLKESEEKAVKDAGKKVKGSKKAADGSEKKKRSPSVFNLYVKDVMPSMKEKHPNIKDGKQMIGLAAESWKNDPMAEFIKEKVLEMKKDDKDGDVVEMYAKAKKMFTEESEPNEKEEVKPKGKGKKVESEKEDEVKPKGKGKKVESEKEDEKPKGNGKKVVKESNEDEE